MHLRTFDCEHAHEHDTKISDASVGIPKGPAQVLVLQPRPETFVELVLAWDPAVARPGRAQEQIQIL